jgi:pseudaminic acid biosynthesis-associated methylase
LARANNINSIIEFGANIGTNLEAIKRLLPAIELSAVEINATAAEMLKSRGDVKVYHQSILKFKPDYKRDLVLTKTVLIHINPDLLPRVYSLLHQTSKKYICIAEYYNPSPMTVTYRGNKNKLFKRDFAGEMLDKFKDLKLIDYGFAYYRDQNYDNQYDDINWFLLEKKHG